MEREQRRDKQQRLYTLLKDIGLGDDRSRGSKGDSPSTAKQMQSSAAAERRSRELTGIGALD
jgi:hypothetical protein